jgi:hypothetical protein
MEIRGHVSPRIAATFGARKEMAEGEEEGK